MQLQPESETGRSPVAPSHYNNKKDNYYRNNNDNAKYKFYDALVNKYNASYKTSQVS